MFSGKAFTAVAGPIQAAQGDEPTEYPAAWLGASGSGRVASAAGLGTGGGGIASAGGVYCDPMKEDED